MVLSRNSLILIGAAAALSGAALYVAAAPKAAAPPPPPPTPPPGSLERVVLQLLDQGTINGAWSARKMSNMELSLDGKMMRTDANGEAVWDDVPEGEHTILLGNADIHDEELLTHDGFAFQGEVLNPIHLETSGGVVVAQIVVHEVALEQVIEPEEETFTLDITVEEV